MEEDRSAFSILTGIPTGKRPLGRRWYGWEYNNIKGVKEICVNTTKWADSAQDRDY